MLRYPGAKRRHAERVRVADRRSLQRAYRGLAGRTGRGKARLADFHMNDRAAGGLKPLCRGSHIHREKRRHIGPLRMEESACTIFNVTHEICAAFAPRFWCIARPMPSLTPPRKSRAGFPARAVCLAVMFAFGSASISAPAVAQEANNRLAPVRDAEIEELMRDYVTPVLRAAGQEPSAVQIHLVRDMSFNAFVANGRRIFINLGAIVDAKTPNQLIGVLAHETGHIAGGHLSAMRQKLEEAQTRAIIAMLLGAAAVGAGAASGASGSTIAGGAQAAVTAPGEIIKRDLLSYIRSQEQAADQAAVSYLTKTGQSPKGMLEVFKGFADKSMFNVRFVDPYAQTHPMPVERIALLERIANESPYLNAKDSDELLKRHKMVQAKIIGFVRPMDTVLRTYPPSDTSLPARYARAVATYRFGSVEVAQREIDSLISTEPNNPYFWELKGQALLEAGRPRQAIEPLRRASSLKPKSGLIRDHARRSDGREQRQQPARCRDHPASPGNRERTGVRRRLPQSGERLRPKEPAARGRSRLGTGRVLFGRRRDGQGTCSARQATLLGRFARLVAR